MRSHPGRPAIVRLTGCCTPTQLVASRSTEGGEITVLRALRPVWDDLNDIVMELQPRAWSYSNVSMQSGLATIKALMTRRNYSAITLPHRLGNRYDWNKTKQDRKRDAVRVLAEDADVARWNACARPPRRKLRPSDRAGINSSVRLDYPGLEWYIRTVYRNPAAWGFFSEVLLIRCPIYS